MILKHKIFLTGLKLAALTLILSTMGGSLNAQVRANEAVLSKTALKDAKILPAYNFSNVRAVILKPPVTEPAEDVSEDGDPTGPSGQISATLLADVFDAASPKHIRNDFNNRIPFSDQLFRDHTSLNTYYFYPSGYLLKRDKTDGFDINFLHRTRSDGSGEELILLTFTLVPRELEGGVSLVRKLAALGVEPPANKKPVALNRLPISNVKVSLAGLSSLIPEENVQVINTPNVIGDPIRVQARMNQSQKEDLVASIRRGGLSGDITFDTNDDSFRLEIPYLVSFTDYSGDWLSDISKLSTNESLENVSPFPLLFTGFVVYTHEPSGNQLKRYEIPVSKAVLMEPGAVAKADKTFQELTGSYGEVIAAWPTYERVTCTECLNAIEQKILVSPAQARKTDLPIEVIPSLFEQFSMYKVIVEVRSRFFSASSEYEETEVFTFRKDEHRTTAALFVDRDGSGNAGIFEYRVKPILNSGEETDFSPWKGGQGVMDITVTAGDIRSQVNNE